MIDGEAVECEEEEEAVAYEGIDKLQEHGINAADIKKLKDAGIHTVAAVIMSTRKRIEAIKGMSDGKVEKIFGAAQRHSDFSFVSGLAVLQRRQSVRRISTGSEQLNGILGGGIESASITEAFGEFRTGKTQLAHTLCVTAQLPIANGGGNGKVVFIDTEGTFRPDRILAIAERFGVDGNAVLDNIHYARAYTHEHQIKLITEAAAAMIQDRFALAIIDSATALFRVDYTGRGQLAERQQKLGFLLSALNKLAEEFNVAVYLTNQVQADPSGAQSFVADPKKPIGGHVMAHACCTRLSLKKGRGEQRICKIYDSPSLPENEAVYALTEGGVADAKE